MSEEKKNALDAEELTEVAGGDEPDAPDPENKGFKCPKCGSPDVYVDYITTLFHCRSCGYEW